jgi:YjbE family integral membrane protein
MEMLYAGMSPAEWWTGLAKVIWIDILLAGDNAIVIAMACRALPPEQRRTGIMLGAGAAVGLRIFFALIVTYLLGIPYLKLIGGVLLFWIAYKLLTQHDEVEEIEAKSNLWGAVRTIAIADLVMSLDNVIAIAGAAAGNNSLIIIGLLVSIPLVVGGATLLSSILERFPILVWAGAALLGWIAGELIVTDPAVKAFFSSLVTSLGLPLTGLNLGITTLKSETSVFLGKIAGAGLVILIGLLFRRATPKAAGH